MRTTYEEDKVIDEALNILGPVACVNRFAYRYASAVAAVRDTEKSMNKRDVWRAQQELAELRIALETMIKLYGPDGVEKQTGMAVDALRLKVRLKKISEPIYTIIK